MSGLVGELKTEHATLLKMLGLVEELSPSSKEGFDILQQAKDALLEHLQKEDDSLYPALRKEAETNNKVNGILNMFTKDMKEITGFAMDFFTNYTEPSDDIEFLQSFGKLAARLQMRIKEEERNLYPEFEKIAG